MHKGHGGREDFHSVLLKLCEKQTVLLVSESTDRFRIHSVRCLAQWELDLARAQKAGYAFVTFLPVKVEYVIIVRIERI